MSTPTSQCFICHELLTDIVPTLECSVCAQRCHRRCARSSLGGSDCVPLSSAAWICATCETNKSSALAPLLSNDHFQAIMNQLTNLTKLVSSCDKRIEDLNNTVSAQSLAITTCVNDISALRTENEHMKNKMATLERKLNDCTSPSSEEIYAESAERLRRKNNILLLGIPETSPDDDSAVIKSVLNNVSPDSVNYISSVTRLGKVTNVSKPRPYRVIFQNPEAALNVLKKKNNLSRNSHPAIKIVSDLTPNQTRHLNNLRQELQLRLKSDRNLTIKYINGVPKIVPFNQERDSSKRGRDEDISPKRDLGLKIAKPSSSEQK